MDNPSLQIEIETFSSTSVVSPLGDIDLSKSNDLREALRPVLDTHPDKIIIDLSHVPYMDSSGIATLIEGLQLAKQANIEFILCCLSEGVHSIMELARLEKIFTIVATRDQAFAE